MAFEAIVFPTRVILDRMASLDVPIQGVINPRQ
jgi:hypothetical protein